MNFTIPEGLVPKDPRFGVGPSVIPLHVLDNLRETKTSLLGRSHRKDAVIELIRNIQEGFTDFFKLPKDYLVVVGNGGASFLFDMIGLGLVHQKSAHFCCGEFSHKWLSAHKNIPWIETVEKSVANGSGINPCDVEDSDMICATLNETSTGAIINSVPDLRKTSKLVAIDATSGGGQVRVDMKKVDLFFLSPQKVMASEGGTFICLMSPKAQARAMELSKRQRYIPKIMDWEQSINFARKSQTLNTPSITSLFYLDQQLKQMNSLGIEKVEALALKKAKFIYDWVSEREYLTPYIQDENFRGHAVAVINLDTRYDARKITDFLENSGLAYDIGGYRKLGLNQFRIGLFHAIDFDDLVCLTRLIDSCVQQMS